MQEVTKTEQATVNILVQYDEFQDSIRQDLGIILHENNPSPDEFLNLTPYKELEKELVFLAKVTKEMKLRDVQELKEFPSGCGIIEAFQNHCHWDCDIGHNEGCDELACLKFWAEYSPEDFLEAIDYV